MHETKSHTMDHQTFGFWIYLMTDLVLFGVLFATFLVLHKNTFGGPSGQTLFELPAALAETLILLTSSFTCALGMLSVHAQKKKGALFWFALTFLLGIAFLIIEIAEFSKFIHQDAGPSRSGFLSSYFALVGTHGFHIAVGLLWMGVALYQIGFRPLHARSLSQIYRMALFWHFLDFVWIFIFTTVYGLGYLT